VVVVDVAAQRVNDQGAVLPDRALVVAGGVDAVFGQDFTCGGVAGDHVLVMDEHQDGLAGMGASDAQLS
jgi:hypothetical protein